ncbi:MAG: hypothetical protein U0930_26135 [Pirellulales bacterium]
MVLVLAAKRAAMQAAKSDKHVAIFERYIRIGAAAGTHWGTIPSKVS